MTYIPGWPSLTEPDFTCKSPDPMPGSISDFVDEISVFENRCEDGKAQIRRNHDALALEKRHIAENLRYIARLQRLAAQLRAKGKKVPETFAMNIASAEEENAESREIISMLPAHEAKWIPVIKKCQEWLTWMRDMRRRGIDPKTGQARLCRYRDTTTGHPCKNPAHFRINEGWKYCTIPGHAAPKPKAAKKGKGRRKP